MHIDGYVQALKQDLGNVAQLGDENAQRAAQLLAVALESSFGRRLLEALNEAALELSTQLHDARVEVRLSGDEPQFVVVEEGVEPAAADHEAATARITLRLPESLKARIEEAASRDGASVNTWLVHALLRSVEPRRPTSGRRRMSGYAES
jgi:predicted HicB family RNase H-like nuclease